MLYKEVGDLHDWERKLKNWLIAYILKLQSAESQPSGLPASSPLLPVPVPASTVPAGDANPAPKQLVRVAESLSKIVRSGDIEFPDGDAYPLSEFQVARLFLLSATWMFRRFTGETVGTHELNLLYKHREELETTVAEDNQLFRALVADRADLIPGWYWFRSLTRQALTQWLIELAFNDTSAEVRANAVRLLRISRIEIPGKRWSALPLSDESDAVRSEAYAYLAEIGDESAIGYLEESAMGEAVLTSTDAKEAKLSIMMRLKPQDTFEQLAQNNEYLSDQRLNQIEKIAFKASDSALLKALDNDLEGMRKLAIKELARRSGLTREVAEKLTRDPSLAIRALAFTELARQGVLPDFDAVRTAIKAEEKPQSNLFDFTSLLSGKAEPEPDADTVILLFYKGQNSDSVLNAVDWFQLEGALAYKSLAVDHYHAIRDHLRGDLDGGFSRIKQQSIETIKGRHGPEFAAHAVEQFAKVDDFIRSQFTEAALTGLAVNGEAADIRFAQQYLKSDKADLKLAAIRIMARFGGPDDAGVLMEICRDSFGKMREEAGLGALQLSRDPLAVAMELSRSNDTKLSEAGFRWLYTRRPPEVADFFYELLENQSSESRERAVYFFSSVLSQKTLLELLNEQIGKEKYFYNTITWLDRILFAPEPLRGVLKRKLCDDVRGEPSQ